MNEPRSKNPADVLRELLVRAGLEYDAAFLSELWAYCEAPVREMPHEKILAWAERETEKVIGVSSPTLAPPPLIKTGRKDADGHCDRCGTEWPDRFRTLARHECPPGFWSAPAPKTATPLPPTVVELLRALAFAGDTFDNVKANPRNRFVMDEAMQASKAYSTALDAWQAAGRPGISVKTGKER